jgi:uncharacterized membrane protein YeaQ/YmgE (transglycosylase-associated protein family)
LLGTIIGLIIIGLIAGFIARALVPGKQSMTVLQTILLGIVGSFVGGFLGRLLFHHGGGFIQTSSWIGSIIGSVIVLLIYMQFQKRRVWVGSIRDRVGKPSRPLRPSGQAIGHLRYPLLRVIVQERPGAGKIILAAGLF